MESGQVGELLGQAGRYLVGGCLGMFRMPDEVATVFHRGEGSRIFDVEGREYIDYVMGSGPLILGHTHPAVVAAVREQIGLGTTFYGLNAPVIHIPAKPYSHGVATEKPIGRTPRPFRWQAVKQVHNARRRRHKHLVYGSGYAEVRIDLKRRSRAEPANGKPLVPQSL